jgi:hypothetical protein
MPGMHVGEKRLDQMERNFYIPCRVRHHGRSPGCARQNRKCDGQLRVLQRSGLDDISGNANPSGLKRVKVFIALQAHDGDPVTLMVGKRLNPSV